VYKRILVIQFSNNFTMTDSSPVLSDSRLLGRVKWFNNKSGFGFITVCGGEHNDKDIFVHYSSIRAESQQYKYLVQGEYVEFVIIKSDSANHEYHASDVSGVKEGILMCETHRQNTTQNSRPGGRYMPRNSRDDGGDFNGRAMARSESNETGGFTEVKRRRRHPASATVPV